MLKDSVAFFPELTPILRIVRVDQWFVTATYEKITECVSKDLPDSFVIGKIELSKFYGHRLLVRISLKVGPKFAHALGRGAIEKPVA